MMKKSSLFISGLLAFGIYFVLIGVLLFYFNSREEKKSVHYVKKDEHRIQVAISVPKKVLKSKAAKPKAKRKPKSKKPKVKPKRKSKKVVKKKVIKEKVVKKKRVKKKDVNLTKPKKVTKPKDLFANVSSSKKITKPKLDMKITDKPVKPKKSSLIKVSDKPSASQLVSNSLKVQKSSDSGVENAYLAKVQSMLEGWPAQSEYAGEKVKVLLQIQPSGFFEFKIKSASNNYDFNDGLVEYLEQLQEMGFGRHKGNRAYQFEAEFIAKE
jgi:protein TonB